MGTIEMIIITLLALVLVVLLLLYVKFSAHLMWFQILYQCSSLIL